MPRNRQTLLRTRQGRLALVGAASLVSVLVSAPVAAADGAEPIQTTSVAGSPGDPVAAAPQVEQPAEPVAPPAEPVAPPVEQAPEQPAPVAPPVEQPADAPAEQPAAAPVQPPSERPVDTSADAPVEQPAATQPSAAGGDEPTSAPVPAGVSATSPSASASATEPAAGQVPDDRAVAAILPDFGHGKGGYEVRVDVAQGSALRAGATTAGSTFTITESGTLGQARGPVTCTTETRQTAIASMPSAPTSATFCVLNDTAAELGQRYTGYPTNLSMLTVRQLTAAPGLAVDTREQTFDYGSFFLGCVLNSVCPGPYTFSFFNAALPPVAVRDAARTPRGTRVVVVVQRNDKLFGLPVTGLVVSDAPAHGTATVVDGRVRYVPRQGFVGTDTFTYTIRTASGESTASVTVTVPAPARGPATTKDDQDPTALAQGAPRVGAGTAPTSVRAPSFEQSSAPAPTLPNTGGPEGFLLGLAALLLAAGGRLVAGGRRPGRGAGHA